MNIRTTSSKFAKRYDWTSIEAYVQTHTISEAAKHFGFSKSSWSKAVADGRVNSKSRMPSLETVATVNSTYSRRSLKKRIIENKLIPYKCALCACDPIWKDKPLVLILDHIDGVNNNHLLNNLRFVCPNCNSQLPTHSGKNIKKKNKCPIA